MRDNSLTLLFLLWPLQLGMLLIEGPDPFPVSVQPVSLWPVNVLVCLNSVRVGFYMGCNKKENKARLFKHKVRS